MRRFWHHWEKWECVPAGMYLTLAPSGYTPESALDAYATFLRDFQRFDAALLRVRSEWRISCEQFLSNPSINRIAWLGQSSMCIATGVPAVFKGGFNLLTEREQSAANRMAASHLKEWEFLNC